LGVLVGNHILALVDAFAAPLTDGQPDGHVRV
jgi:hypothetical protein